MTDNLYAKVRLAFRKNYSWSLISFFALLFILNLSYFALSFLSVLIVRVPFLVYPLLLLYAYFFFSVIFGFHYLIYSLYSGERAFLGQLFSFLNDRRMIYVTILYLLASLVFLFVAFIPYYFFADKILDKEIYGLILAQDVSAILKLDHGFSPAFYASAFAWLFLCLFFSFTLVLFPISLMKKKNVSFFHLLSESFAVVFKGSNFFRLIAFCFRCVFAPALIFVFSMAFSFVLQYYKMNNVADIFRFTSVIALFFTYLYSLYAVSAFLVEKIEGKEEPSPVIFLLPPPADYATRESE